MLRLVGLVASLLAGNCQAVHIRSAPENSLTCNGEDCLGLADQIHANEKKCLHYPTMKCRDPKNKELYSMSCKRGRRECSVTFDDPVHAVEASLPDSSSQERNV